MPRSTWFCIDIECNGPVPAIYDMVSLGAVVVGADDQGRLSLGDSFYVEIQPCLPNIDPGAAKVHGLDQDRLKRDGLPRRAALEQLSAWVAAQTPRGQDSTFVGHNAPFDWSFVAWAYAAEGMKNPFGYKALCTKSLSMGALGIHWLDTNKELLAQCLGLPAEDLGQKHRADYDAAYQALILKALLERMGLV